MCVCTVHFALSLLLCVYVLSCRTWTESKLQASHTLQPHMENEEEEGEQEEELRFGTSRNLGM